MKYEWRLKEPTYIDKKDKRYTKFQKQIKEKSFCDSETYGLEYVIASFVLPRLKRFRQLNNGHPMDLKVEEWDIILDKMIFAFDFLVRDEEQFITNEEEDKAHEKVKEGLELFGKWFRHLWW